MSKTQSVILNLNKEYSNSKAHDYFQPVAQQLDIGKNAEVCLYGAAIKRQPIFINKEKSDNTFNFRFFTDVFPSNRQVNYASEINTEVIDIDKLPKPAIDEFGAGFNIEAGGYSIKEFGETLVNNVNSEISRNINGQPITNSSDTPLTVDGDDLVMQFPYSYAFNNDNDNFYLGFQGMPFQRNTLLNDLSMVGKLNNSQEFACDNSEAVGSNGTNLLQYNEESNNPINGCRFITANAAINTTNYQAFSQIHSSSIFPLFRQQKELDSTLLSGQNESYFEFNIKDDETSNNKTTDFVIGFTNTFLQSGWTTTDVPETTTLFPDQVTVPKVFLGVKIFEDVQSGDIVESHAEIFMANKLTQFNEYLDGMANLDTVWQDGCSRVTKIDFNDRLGECGKMGFRFYAVDNQANFYKGQLNQTENSVGKINPKINVTYPRVYGFQFYFRPVGSIKEIVYDSKNDNIFIPSYYLDDGFVFNSARSQRTADEHCNLGFQPYLFVNKLNADDGISSPRGNYIAQYDYNKSEVYYRYGLNYYEYISTNRDLLNVLGIPQQANVKKSLRNLAGNVNWIDEKTKKFDGNAYPEFKNSAGHTKLFTDNTAYNIEINLPVKAYTTTQPIVKEKNVTKISNLGQKRTVLYKTEPLVEGESQGIEQYYIDKNIVPNNLKFLTLNNSSPLNLNELNVQIRRSKTNELATELEDCSVELLIKSE
jgi:hypothetical protein